MSIFNCRNHYSESFTVWPSIDMLAENNLRSINDSDGYNADVIVAFDRG